MMAAPTLVACTLGVAMAAGTLGVVALAGAGDGQPLSRYRVYQMGSSLADVSALAGARVEDAALVHERPALLQTLQVRPARWTAGTSTPSTDAVQELRFSFYDNQLFRIVVDYGRERTAGMTSADIVSALTATYGTPVTGPSRAATRTIPPPDTEAATLLARWTDGSYLLALYRPDAYDAVFRLMVLDLRLEPLARRAGTEASRLDELEAPRLERARQKKEADDRAAAEIKARGENGRLFTP